MNRIQKIIMVVIAFGSVTASVNGQQPSPDSVAKLEQFYMQLGQPGPEHALLAAMAGRWTAEATMWPMPGAGPMTTKFTSEGNMVLGGRFLQTTGKGDIMGMPLEMIGYLGFDRRQKKYTSIGMDTQGTYWVTAFGTYDPATKTMLLYGEDVDPVMRMTQKYDFRYKFFDADHYTFELLFKNPEITGGAPEFKMLEVKYTRVK